MFLPVDLIEVDVLFVDVLELDVLGARRKNLMVTIDYYCSTRLPDV